MLNIRIWSGPAADVPIVQFLDHLLIQSLDQVIQYTYVPNSTNKVRVALLSRLNCQSLTQRNYSRNTSDMDTGEKATSKRINQDKTRQAAAYMKARASNRKTSA